MKTAPRTLDEAIAVLPGLRRFRSLNADLLRKLLDRQKGECTWCGGRVPGRRRTWCSDDCLSAYSLRCDSAAIRRAIEHRDKGVCHYCGLDCMKLKRVIRRADLIDRRHHSWRQAGKYLEAFHRLVGDGTWEAHHTTAVVEGGGLCGLDEIVTACRVCHKEQSAGLAARRKGN